MTRLLVLVEGQSEEIFVKRTLAPYLAARGVYVEKPIVLWTKRATSGGGFRGGASNWSQIQRSLVPLLADTHAWITTLIDFYALPSDVPGYQPAAASGDPRHAVVELQQRIGDEISHPRFLPFLALHEFEAWIFSAPEVVAAHFDKPSAANEIRSAAEQAGGPELIDHGAATHPKARLKRVAASYKETSDGATLIEKIGVEAIRAACPHFAAWLAQLEALAQRTHGVPD